MRSHRRWGAGLTVALVAICVVGGQGQGQLPGVEPLHDAGQDVTPAFEGWYPNPDGTFNLSFGYMNRNLKEEVDIPIGPNNKFEPGGIDQGQPTHFLARRQMGIFTVTVPKDFGNRRLVWTLIRNGKSNSVPGHLDPRWTIDAMEEVTLGNEAPVIRFESGGPTAQGPRPIVASTTVIHPAPATLKVWATDKGPPPREGAAARRAPVLTVTWTKYRGPGKVTFEKEKPEIDKVTTEASTTASFSEPGEYMLRVVANDSTGPSGGAGQCCWTNGVVKVSVKAKPATP